MIQAIRLLSSTASAALSLIPHFVIPGTWSVVVKNICIEGRPGKKEQLDLSTVEIHNNET